MLSPSLSKRGFTLIELLIVIAIIAVLAVTIILTLNPAELLKQTRDSNRASSLGTLGTALAIYMADGGTNLGTSSIIYVSIPDSSPTCANLGLPPAPIGFTYACKPEAAYRNADGTGWVPVNLQNISGSPLSTLPTDPDTSTSTYFTYATDGTTWSVKTVYESAKFASKSSVVGNPDLIPEEWITIAGNSTFGTSEFQVMKYEAKCINATSNVPYPANVLGMYYNNITPCTAANGRYIGSVANAAPIGSVSHNTAKLYCQNIGAHLLTNEEYMTIARSAEQVSSNWSGGSVGSGYLFAGHSDEVPFVILAASTDSDAYFGTGDSYPSNQRRTFTLANGRTIWDLSGNVFEHVMRNGLADTVTPLQHPLCQSGGSFWQNCEYGSSITPYVSDYRSTPFSYIGPSNASWNGNQGVGKVYTYPPGDASGANVFKRGGALTADSYGGDPSIHTGLYATYFNVYDAGASSFDGFRCAR